MNDFTHPTRCKGPKTVGPVNESARGCESWRLTRNPDSDDGHQEPDDLLAEPFTSFDACPRPRSPMPSSTSSATWCQPGEADPRHLTPGPSSCRQFRSRNSPRSILPHRDRSETDQEQRRWPALSVAALPCRPVLPAPPLARPCCAPHAASQGWSSAPTRAGQVEATSASNVYSFRRPHPGRVADKAWPVAATREAWSASAPRQAEGNRRETGASNPA
jgi:hypothetical protein